MLRHPKITEFLGKVEKSLGSALLLDYDGTLAPFSTNRDRALPYEGVVDTLRAIVGNGRTRLVVITGRDAREVGPLLGLKPPPEIWGAHGLQRLWPDGSCEVPDIPSEITSVLDDAERWLTYQGLGQLAERKIGSVAIHWRTLNETEASELRARILLGWSCLADQSSLQLLEFDGGVELHMTGIDKGTAVRTILAEIHPDVPIAYLGDDATDENAFAALAGHGLTVLVRPVPRRTSAQVWLRPPDELLEFLRLWEKVTAESPQPFVASSTRLTSRSHARR
jgi:trehalose 6-phosphate phosphatase